MTREEFVLGVSNWDNHRPLLWLALQETKGNVIELGCGEGSTPYLQRFCKENSRNLESYDYNQVYAEKYGAYHITNWDFFNFSRPFSVALVDESPGEQRKVSIQKLIGTEIIVVHDSEPAGWNASDYRVRPVLSMFRYAVDIRSAIPQGAWATAVSNSIDVTQWIGQKFGDHEVVAFTPEAQKATGCKTC